MVHFDAHADTGDIEFGSLWGHGQPMRRLIESGALRGDRFLQIGLRGYWPDRETFEWMRDQGLRWHTQVEMEERGVEAVIDEAIAQAKGELVERLLARWMGVEAKPIVDFLVRHCTQHAFTCRLRWEPGMVAMWDNRAAMHLGPNDYDGYRREMAASMPLMSIDCVGGAFQRKIAFMKPCTPE